MQLVSKYLFRSKKIHIVIIISVKKNYIILFGNIVHKFYKFFCNTEKKLIVILQSLSIVHLSNRNSVFLKPLLTL